jgi:hypothetical protein
MTQNTIVLPHLVSRVEAARALGIRPQTLAVWACTGRYNLPMVKIGRCVKYRQSDLDNFIARNVIGGETLQ